MYFVRLFLVFYSFFFKIDLSFIHLICLSVDPLLSYFYQEKKALREEKMKQEEKYMWAIVDGVKEKV
jgi:hypothetical protein